MNLLTEYVGGIARSALQPKRRLWVFDFDDTLVKTDAMVHVSNPITGGAFDLTPGEFASYERQVVDVLNYDDFERLVNPRSVKWMMRILRNVCAHHGASRAVVLSARGFSRPIAQFLDGAGLPGVEVAPLGDASPLAKARWIAERIARDDLDEVEFFDDSHKNVAAVEALRRDHPGTRIIARHVHHRKIAQALGVSRHQPHP